MTKKIVRFKGECLLATINPQETITLEFKPTGKPEILNIFQGLLDGARKITVTIETEEEN